VRLFAKQPAWFKVATPVGQYNPDWGLVMDQADAFGDASPLLYLVRETKRTTVQSDLILFPHSKDRQNVCMTL
jgi:type III restriction enzyme